MEIETAVLSIASRDLREESRKLRARIDELERLELSLRSELAAEAEAHSREMEQTVKKLEAGLFEKLLVITKLQAHIDTVESRHLGRTADLEKLLKHQKRENQIALALVPELRDELVAAQRELGEFRAAASYFGGSFATTGGNPQVLLEEIGNRLRSAESQVAEFTGILCVAAGEQARGVGWREDLSVVESDRQQRLDIIHKLSRQVQAFEGGLGNRVEQIRVLRLHAANILRETAAVKNRILSRLMPGRRTR